MTEYKHMLVQDINDHVNAYESSGKNQDWPAVPDAYLYYKSDTPNWQCASAFTRACQLELQRRQFAKEYDNDEDNIEQALYGVKPENWDDSKGGSYETSTKTKRARNKVFEGQVKEGDKRGETVTLVGTAFSKWII